MVGPYSSYSPHGGHTNSTLAAMGDIVGIYYIMTKPVMLVLLVFLG